MKIISAIFIGAMLATLAWAGYIYYSLRELF